MDMVSSSLRVAQKVALGIDIVGTCTRMHGFVLLPGAFGNLDYINNINEFSTHRTFLLAFNNCQKSTKESDFGNL